jgi:hypothetical protein
MNKLKSPRLILAPGESITADQAAVLLDHYAYHAGELVAGVAMALHDRGIISTSGMS